MNFIVFVIFISKIQSGPVDELSDSEKKFATAGKSCSRNLRVVHDKVHFETIIALRKSFQHNVDMQ